MAATPEQYYNLFKVSPNGTKVLEDMMRAHFFFDSTFTPSCPEETFIREGERNAVLRILTILDTYEKEKMR